MDFKTTKKPKHPFLYVAGRPYAPLQQERPLGSEALTEERGDRIIALKGRTLDVIADYGLESLIVASAKATLTDYAKIPFDGTGCGLSFEVFDWVYRFHLDTVPEFMEKLYACRDQYIKSDQGFDQAMAHWGTERWSGLYLRLQHEQELLLSTKIDVFAPKQEPISIVAGIYSHKPELLRKLHKIMR
ncbi:hypothetical protein C4573_04445 [Candidatus Woesearchaeota archaeon]|nr:MAG: hypothetical protein C4573_04445 [Candidatus Woesearchaeota archaeon]